MSSSRPTEPTVRRRGPAGWSLRTRLLVALVALVAAVCAVIGVGTTVAVYQFQVGRLDNQLRNVVSLAAQRDHGMASEQQGSQPSQPPPRLADTPGMGPGTVTVRIVGGQTMEANVLESTRGALGSSVVPRPLPTALYSLFATLPVNMRPYVRQVGSLGDYRIMASTAEDGDILVVGLPMTEVYATRNQLIALEIGIGLAAAILAALIGALIIRSNLRPLRRVAATASRVAELPLDRGEVALSVRVPEVDTDPRTEVGQVGAALNRMLGHVAAALAARQASETRVRHFVADASHELRTPLAAIRGYAELTRRVSDEVPPAVAHAMRRVESETARMTTLVDDLLLLARLDSGRPLVVEPVDLSRLVIDAVSDAHVAGPDHHWRLDLPEESVTVPGDPARLHQVLANLLANARTHTPPGTTVRTSLRVSRNDVALTVLDDGPGIPAALLPEVFDRFARGDTSRSRAAGSTGLGLAIVAAVVEAHHGRVEVASQPGKTEFTVHLPTGGMTHPERPALTTTTSGHNA